MENTQLVWAVLLVISTYKSNAQDNWSGRTWQSNLNFNNSRNWNIGRVPCDTDRIILQKSDSIVLELPDGRTSLRELVLPSYSEILLPKDGVIQFTRKKYSSSCDGKDAIFKPTQAFLWTDPNNWDRWTQATPDLERVPCASDAVRFPAGSTFRILMPSFIKLGSLEINGVSMDSMDWYMFVNYGEGVRQFYKNDGDSADVEISGQPCQTSQWCECGNEYLQAELCKGACPLPLCKNPVKPSGFCCSICGVYFLLGSKSENKHQLTEHISSFLTDRQIAWHASRVGEFVQVVLVEQDEYSGEVPEIAEDLKTSLVNSGMGWVVEEFHASGHVWYPTTFGQVVGHFFSFAVFAGLVLAAIVVFYSQNWSWIRLSPLESGSFVFARFENQSGEVVVASEPRQQCIPVIPQAFDNPMYGATSKEQRNITLENPVYTELEETPMNNQMNECEEGVTLESIDFSK